MTRDKKRAMQEYVQLFFSPQSSIILISFACGNSQFSVASNASFGAGIGRVGKYAWSEGVGDVCLNLVIKSAKRQRMLASTRDAGVRFSLTNIVCFFCVFFCFLRGRATHYIDKKIRRSDVE